MVQEVKNFGRFYRLLRLVPGISNDTKEDLILEFTKGRTSSLREMRKSEYSNLCNALDGLLGNEARKTKDGVDMDKLRKRVIAAVGEFLKCVNRDSNIAVIKAVACRAAGVESFNRIGADRLRSLYNSFRLQAKDLRTAKGVAVTNTAVNVGVSNDKTEA